MLESSFVNPRRRQEHGWRAGFVALLGAVAAAAVGEAMMIVAVPWFVLETTGSVTQTGFVVAVGSVGAGVTGFAAGPLVDRVGFKATAVTSYLVGGAAAAAIPLLHDAGRLDFPALLGLVLVVIIILALLGRI